MHDAAPVTMTAPISSGRSRLARAAGVVVMLCLSACATLRSDDDVTRLPFTLGPQGNVLVEATLNRRDRVTLMLHTAASQVMLTEDGARKAPSVRFVGTDAVESWGGTSSSRTSPGNVLGLGTLERRDVRVWEDVNSGAGSDGKFGLDAFGDRIVELDFDTRQLVVHDRLPAKVAHWQRLPLERADDGLFVTATCLVDGVAMPNRFLIHSGYAGGVLLDDAFVARNGLAARIPATETQRLTDAFGHVIEVRKGVLPGFALGDDTLHDVPVGFFPGAVGRQTMSVLGMAVLARYDLVFDPAGKALYLHRRDTRSDDKETSR